MSDVVTLGPDSSAPDTVTSEPDAVRPSDGRDSGPDAGPSDGRDAGTDGMGADAVESGPDGSGSDAVKPPLDGLGSDAVKMGPDSNTSEVLDAGFDGRSTDAADAGADRRASEVADAGADGQGPEVTVWSADGGTRKDEIIHACALAVSCASQANTYSASRCIQELGKTASRRDDIKPNQLLACAQATNCSDFRACWGGDLFTLDPFVRDGECDGNSIRVTPAGASGPQGLNCSALGGVCEMLATGVNSVACNARSCSEGQRPDPACDGTTASGCGGWSEYTSLDCAWSGRKCQVEGNQAVCAGTGAACSESDKVTCAGSVATYCSGGARATVDCAKTETATRCAAGAPSTEPCAVAGTGCDPASFVDHCDGNRLVVCVDGSLTSIPCNDVGFLVLCFDSSVGAAACTPGT